jgi:hypothetical protein
VVSSSLKFVNSFLLQEENTGTDAVGITDEGISTLEDASLNRQSPVIRKKIDDENPDSLTEQPRSLHPEN